MKVLVTGTVGATGSRLMLALATIGAEVVTAETFEVKPREICGGWRDPEIALERQRSYGPPVKGKGGKVKRW